MIERRDFWAGIVLVGLLAGGMLLAVLLLTVVSADEPLITQDCVAVAEIVGGIYAVRDQVELLDTYAENDRVKAVLLELDTPGGGVAATQELYEAVLRIRAEGKPVIASMGSVAASGGYYVAAACDTIMALPATITGSIGVIAMFPNVRELMGKLGIGYETVKTGTFKDTGSSVRDLTPEEREYLDGLVGDMFEQFLEAVSTNRGMPVEQLRTLADGRVFTGRQAAQNGLIDLLGTRHDAVILAGAMGGLGDDPPVYRDSGTGFFSGMYEGLADVAARFGNRIPMVSYQMSF